MKKTIGKKDVLLWILLAVLAAGIGFSGWKLYGILADYRLSQSIYDSAAAEYTVRRAAGASAAPVRAEEENSAEEAASPFTSVSVLCDFEVDFIRLQETNPDVAGWISSPGTVIDYPVMLGADNDVYLHTSWEGTYAASGSIFLSYLCGGDLSDYSTVIYGHNMKSGSMFHAIKSYNSQSYYEEHPYIWYLTPEAYYLLYVVSGFETDTSDRAYVWKSSEEEVADFLAYARKWSDFDPTWVVDGMDAEEIVSSARRVVILSTCSMDSEDARYVLVTVPLLAQ